MGQRFMYALLGALLASGVVYWVAEEVRWTVVGVAAAVCGVLGVLGGYFGPDFTDWLKEAWWWS